MADSPNGSNPLIPWLLLVCLILLAFAGLWFWDDDPEPSARETASAPAEAGAGGVGIGGAGAGQPSKTAFTPKRSRRGTGGGQGLAGAATGFADGELAQVTDASSADLEDSKTAVEALATEAGDLIQRGELFKARSTAMKCLALDRDNATCWQARVRSYTRGHEIPEVKGILRYCLAAQRDELNCLRELRKFHLERGESMQGSSLGAEIQQFYPEEALEAE